MPGKRENVISWDEFFMRAAVAASLRSKDPNTQVGACQRQLAAKQPKEPRPKLTARESRVRTHGWRLSGYMAVVT